MHVLAYLQFPPKRGQKMTIDQLEAILDSEEDVPIEILPNGEIVVGGSEKSTGPRKPLTMRENLGGEYAYAT
jgi:hypothetical protein